MTIPTSNLVNSPILAVLPPTNPSDKTKKSVRSTPKDKGKLPSSNAEEDVSKKHKRTDDLPPIPKFQEVNYDETSTNCDG